jgi:hypothetical protein
MKIKTLLIGLSLVMLFPLTSKAQTCVKTAPFFEGFDYRPWVVTTGGRSYDTCWQIGAGIARWGPGGLFFGVLADIRTCDSTGSLMSSGYVNDSLKTGNYYLRLSPSRRMNQNEDLVSPWVDVSALVNPALQFDYHMYGKDIDRLEYSFQYINDTNWINLGTLIGEQQHSLVDFFKQEQVELPNLLKDTVRFRFRAVTKLPGSGKYWPLAKTTLDNFAVMEYEDCFMPLDVSIQSINPTTAVINYASPAAATDVEIRYGIFAHEDLPGKGSKVISSGGSDTLTGLVPGQSYLVHLRSLCPTKASYWSEPVYFETSCAGYVADFPYLETMDQWGVNIYYQHQFFSYKNTDVRGCWQNEFNCDDGYWSLPDLPRQIAVKVTDTLGSYALTGITADDSARHLITVPVDLRGSIDPILRFDYIFPEDDFIYGDTNIFYIDIDTGNGWLAIDSILPPQQSDRYQPWREKVVDIAAYKNAIVKVRFRFQHANDIGGYGAFYLDEVHFKEANGLGKAELAKETFWLEVYPNPVRRAIQLQFAGEAKIRQVNVFNTAGEKVFSAAKQVNEIGIENWASGLYLLQITTDKGVYGRRFVKE